MESPYTLSVDKEEIVFDNPLREQKISFAVCSDIEWTVEMEDKSWIDMYEIQEPDSKNSVIQLTSSKNDTGSNRSTQLLITAKDRKAKPIIIRLEQLAQPSENILDKIPEGRFKYFLISKYFRFRYATQGDILMITYIDCRNSDMRSLEGIEYFKELTHLNCSSNNLRTLDLSQNKELISLNCSSNFLNILDISQNEKLYWLDCSSNELSALDVYQNKELVELDCNSNAIEVLDISQNENLERLACYTNKLSALDVYQNRKLKSLSCFANQLTSKKVKISKSKYDIVSLYPSKGDEIYNVVE